MPEYKPYYYYAKNDPNKEAIDKILAFDFESAAIHFSNRKQLELSDFFDLYEIVNSYEGV
jgi:hypothetical protein